MSGHTPGPWEARRNSSYWEVNPVHGAGDNGIPFSVAEVCPSAPGDPDGGLQEANARLIAAAPDLLEACLAMIEWDDREQDHAVNFAARMELCDLAFAKARAAIARAKGEI